MKKNKKGQEFSVVTLVILGLAILTAVIIGWGFYTNWTFITGKTDVLPSDLALKAEACKLSTSNLPAYCGFGDPLKISGISGDVYVNCEYSDPNFMAEIKKNIANPPDCDANTEQSFCVQLRGNAGFKRAVINSFVCSPLMDSGGKTCLYQWVPKDQCSTEKDYTFEVTDKKEFNDNIVVNRCCNE